MTDGNDYFVFEDPRAPTNTVYLLNQNYLHIERRHVGRVRRILAKQLYRLVRQLDPFWWTA